MEKILKKIESFLEEGKKGKIFDKIEEFHDERIKTLKNNETPKPFPEGGKIILHLIPLESFLFLKHYDLSIYKGQILALKPMRFDSLDQTYNFDGLLHFERRDKKCLAYVQIYVNGIIESVDSYYLGVEDKVLFILEIEERIMSTTKEYLKFQKELGIKPPIIFYLALLGTKDFLIRYGHIDEQFNNINPVDREDLILPKIIIDEFDVLLEEKLKTSFDRIWNACGYPRSFHYNEKGEFIAR